MTTKELTGLHKEGFETWRFQIESYWTRNAYFGVFEVAALGGVWTISKDLHLWSGGLAAVAGASLTVVWWLSNDRQHEYVKFYWEKLIEFEAVAFEEWQRSAKVGDVRPMLLTADFERWRSARQKRRRLARLRQYEYSTLIQWVPWIFQALWIYLLAYNVHALNALGLLGKHWKH